MRRNDGETESAVEAPIMLPPGHKPGLLRVSIVDLIERLEARLTGPLRAYYNANQEKIQKFMFSLLKKKKVKLLEDRALSKTTGSTYLIAKEPVYTFPDVESAKEAVLGMVADLASLPPPLPEPFNDDVGFSMATNGALRAFLARVSQGYVEDKDYLHAARLLITHSKTQLPRAAVMGAVRTLEEYLKPERVTPPGAKKPQPEDYQIYQRERLARGSVPLTQTATLSWTYSPKTGYLSLSTKTLDFKKVRDAINGWGANAKITVTQNRAGYNQYFLDLSIKEVPLLVRYLRSEYPEAADRLQTSWEGWTEQIAQAPAPQAVKKTAQPSTSLPDPGWGKFTGELNRGEYYAPDPKVVESGGSRNISQKFPAFSWEVTPAGVLVGLTTRDRVEREGGLPGESISALYSFARYFKAYGKNLKVEDYKVLVPTTPTHLAGFLQEWFQRTGRADDLKEIPFFFDFALPALAEAWKGSSVDSLVQLKPNQVLVPQGFEVLYEAKPARYLVGGTAELTDLRPLQPELHKTWAELVSGNNKQVVRDLAFAYEWSRLIAAGDDKPEEFRTATGMTIVQDASKIKSMGFKGETPLPTDTRIIDMIATIAKEIPEPSYSACRGVFVVPTKMAGQADLLSDLGFAWDVRSLQNATEATKSKIVVIGTDNPSEICGWFLFIRYKTNPEGKRISDGKGNDVREAVLMYYSANLYQEGLEDSLRYTDRIGLIKRDYTRPFPVPVATGRVLAQWTPRLCRLLDLAGEFVLSYTMRIAFLSDYMLNCPEVFPMASAASFADLPRNERAQIEGMFDWNKVQYLNKDYPGGPKMMGLMDYQKIGAAYVWMRGGRALIGDAMGLGKTVQAITAVRMKAPQTLPAVVVCPSSVLYNWADEIERWYPQASVFIADPKKKLQERDGLTDEERKADFIILGWSGAKRLGPRYYDRIKTLIVDESHYGKKFSSVRSIAVRALSYQAEYAIVMSGTALDNAKLEELWPQLSMVDPEVFGEEVDSGGYYQYRDNFVPNEKSVQFRGTIATFDSVDNLRRRLNQTLRCYMIRRLKNQVPLGLGEKKRLYLEVMLSPAQKAAYRGEMAGVLQIVIKSIQKRRIEAALKFLKDGQGKITVYQATEAANAIEKLDPQKIAKVAFVIYAIARQAVAKIKVPFAIERIVTHLQEQPNDPVVVFVEFDANMQLIQEALDARGIPYVFIDGSVSALERRRRVQMFQQGKAKVFLGTRAAREGITLTRANYTLFVDRWFVPAWEEQAEDRTYRYTQTRDVTIEFLVAKETIDEQINALIERKREIISAVVGEDEFEEIEEKADKEVADEYSSSVMEVLQANIEGLKELSVKDTIIDEQMVRDAAAADPAFADPAVEAAQDPGTRRFKMKEIWDYVKGQGGVTFAQLEEEGYTSANIKAGIQGGYLTEVTRPRVLKNNGRARTNGLYDPEYLPSFTLKDVPKVMFKIQPGQFKVRRMVERKVTENPRRVTALISKRYR